jgi:Na+/melibiose symporter-like transporter
MKNNMSLFFLISAFGIEIFCSQVIFIYVPLFMIFGGEGDSIASLFRSLAYIGPVLCGYLIGRIVDIFDKRNMGCVIALLLSSVAGYYSFRLPGQTLTDTFILLMVVSIGTYVLNNLRSCVVPNIAAASQLAKVNSLLLILENATLVVAPLVVSLLLSLDTPIIGFMLISALFFLSGFLYFFSLPKRSAKRELSGTRSSFSSNVQVLISNKSLLNLVCVVMGNNAFTGIYLLHILILAIDVNLFNANDAPYLLITFALGAIVSGSTASKVINRFGDQKLALVCCILMALFGIVPTIIQTKASFFASSFFVGFFESYVVIAVWTLRQQLVPPDVLGSVTGITSTLFKLSMVIGIPTAGVISEAHGASAAILLGVLAVFFGVFPLAKSFCYSVSLNTRS